MANTWNAVGTTWGQNQWSDQGAVDVPITGISATSSVGIATAFNEAGWGSDTWGVENWGESGLLVPITGLSATTALGAPTIVRYPGWGTLTWGQNGWGDVSNAKEILTGLSATSAVGTITPPDQVIGLTGLPATIARGSLGLTIDATLTLSGRQATAAPGALLVGIGITLTGVQALSAVGSPTARSDYTESLTGLSTLQTALGEPDVTSNPTVQPTGLSATSAVGAITPPDQTMGLTGLSATSAVGTLPVIPAEVIGLTGLAATASVSSIGVAPIAWGRVTAEQTGNWTRITS